MENVRELKPRNLWSEKEDSVLRSEVARQAEHGKAKDWRTIAEKLPGRSNKGHLILIPSVKPDLPSDSQTDCRKRWIKLDGPVKKGPWSQEEDQRLHKAVLLHSNVWTEVAQVVGTRHADQCAKRWLHFLNPSLNHGEWSEQEDERLLAAVERGGRNWRRIVDEILQGRSATDAKNRHAILQRNMKNATVTGLDRPRQSFSRRRRIGSTLEVSENLDKSDWWPTDSVDLMRDLLHYSVPTTTGGLQLQGSNFDALLVEQSDHIPSPPLETGLSHDSSHDYGELNPSCEWQAMSNNHPYHELSNGHGFDLSSNCIPSPFENSGDNSLEITDSFIEALTSMVDTEKVIGLNTPSASSHSADCFQILQGETGTSAPVEKGEEMDEEDGEEIGKDEGIDEALTEKSERLLVNSNYNDLTMPSIEEILGTVSRGNRKSTMILQHMQSDQVGQVLELLFSSGSTVNVKIVGED